MGEAGPTAVAVVEKADPKAERRWSAADSACALAHQDGWSASPALPAV
jgi:hypothetical protein